MMLVARPLVSKPPPPTGCGRDRWCRCCAAARMLRTKTRCSSRTMSRVSCGVVSSVVATLPGAIGSTPYGLPPMCSSIQWRSISKVSGPYPAARDAPNPRAFMSATDYRESPFSSVDATHLEFPIWRLLQPTHGLTIHMGRFFRVPNIGEPCCSSWARRPIPGARETAAGIGFRPGVGLRRRTLLSHLEGGVGRTRRGPGGRREGLDEDPRGARTLDYPGCWRRRRRPKIERAAPGPPAG